MEKGSFSLEASCLILCTISLLLEVKVVEMPNLEGTNESKGIELRV